MHPLPIKSNIRRKIGLLLETADGRSPIKKFLQILVQRDYCGWFYQLIRLGSPWMYLKRGCTELEDEAW